MRNIYHEEINFSPYATNVLDCLDRTDLSTPYGDKVNIKMVGMEFEIEIGDRLFTAYSNTEASYILNSFEVGIPR